MATQDDYIRTALRVPPGLHAQIHEAAKSNNRTFNAEIVARLQSTFTSIQGSLGGFEMQMDFTDDVAFTPQQVKLMKEVAAETAKQVVAFQAESLQPVHFGGGSVVLGPPPGHKKKPVKKSRRD